MDSIGMIYWNTLEMYRRFWKGHMPSVDEVSTKLREETEELITELGDGYKAVSAKYISDEIADVITVAIGAGISCGLSLDEIDHAIMRSIIKNGNKQPDTHKRVNETIVPKDDNNE